MITIVGEKEEKMTHVVWTLLRLNPAHQPRFTAHLAENLPEIEYYFPLFRKLTRPHRQRHPISVTLPVYPGYVFCRIDPNTGGVHRLISTPVRAYFIKFGRNISIVPDAVISDLRLKESTNNLVQERIIADPYRPGVKVRIHLPIATIDGIIIQCQGNRVVVDTNLGRAVVVRAAVACQ
jgi:hypothetical protein